MNRHTVRYGNSVITYQLQRRDRRTLSIEVHPDGVVQVIAPEHASQEDVSERVLKRAGWILKQQRAFNAYPPPLPPREFVSGEAYRYLGRQYRLKVIQGDQERARLWRGHLEVTYTSERNQKRIERLVRHWFRENAARVFRERYELSRALAASHGIEHDYGFRLLSMEKRWGSCTPQGLLLLNPALVSAPRDCIDYVITHELVHTVEHNHGARFYRLLTSLMPDWQDRQARLNETTEPVRF